MEFSGTVISGDGYGRTINYPTINIDATDYGRRGLKLTPGVYAGEVTFLADLSKYQAAIVIAFLNDSLVPKLEAHLFDFEKNCYGEAVKFSLTHFIRPYQAFASEPELIKAIEADIVKIKKLNQVS